MNYDPPAHLAGSKAFWQEVIDENDGLGPEDLRLLQCACEQLDLIAQCRNRLRRDGPVIEKKPSGNLAPHPAVAVQKQAILRLQSLLKQLALDVEPEPPAFPVGKVRRTGRPPVGALHTPQGKGT